MSPAVPHELAAVVGLLDQLVKRVAEIPRAAEPLPHWLPLKKAAEVSGLSVSLLLRLCQQGKIAAVKDRGWKIRSAALEELKL